MKPPWKAHQIGWDSRMRPMWKVMRPSGRYFGATRQPVYETATPNHFRSERAATKRADELNAKERGT